MKERIRRAFLYALARGQESSTWRGIVLLASGVGAHVNEERAALIVALGVGIAGLMAAIFPDKPE